MTIFCLISTGRPPQSYFGMFSKAKSKVEKIDLGIRQQVKNTSTKEQNTSNNDPLFQNELIRTFMGGYASYTGNFFNLHINRHHTKEVRAILKSKDQFTFESFLNLLSKKVRQDALNKDGALVRRLIYVAEQCNVVKKGSGIHTDPDKFVNETWPLFAAKSKPLSFDF